MPICSVELEFSAFVCGGWEVDLLNIEGRVADIKENMLFAWCLFFSVNFYFPFYRSAQKISNLLRRASDVWQLPQHHLNHIVEITNIETGGKQSRSSEPEATVKSRHNVMRPIYKVTFWATSLRVEKKHHFKAIIPRDEMRVDIVRGFVPIAQLTIFMNSFLPNSVISQQFSIFFCLSDVTFSSWKVFTLSLFDSMKKTFFLCCC